MSRLMPGHPVSNSIKKLTYIDNFLNNPDLQTDTITLAERTNIIDNKQLKKLDFQTDSYQQ